MLKFLRLLISFNEPELESILFDLERNESI